MKFVPTEILAQLETEPILIPPLDRMGALAISGL